MFFPLHIVGLSSLLGSINSIVTLLKSSNLSIINSFLFLPPYCWSIFFTSVLLIISLPVLAGVITTIMKNYQINCFKEPWVELKSLKTGCILSIIDRLRIDFYFAIVREEIVSINLLRKEYSILHVLLLTLISILHF
jgi:hypothetical protein